VIKKFICNSKKIETKTNFTLDEKNKLFIQKEKGGYYKLKSKINKKF